MSTTPTIPIRIARYLESLPILTIIDRQVMLQTLGLVNEDRAKAFSALEYYTANTGVSNRDDGRSRPKHYYAIKMPLSYAIDLEPATLYLSLTGIPRQLLSDMTADDYVDQIMIKLQTKYGTATIKYWCGSAQYRSVDFGRKGMELAKLRDGTCRLCSTADHICQVKGVQSVWTTPKKITACHIVSRKTVFWTVLSEIDTEFQSIFTDQATIEFTKRMKQNKWHSDSRYIVGLCQEHDAILQAVLTDAAT